VRPCQRRGLDGHRKSAETFASDAFLLLLTQNFAVQFYQRSRMLSLERENQVGIVFALVETRWLGAMEEEESVRVSCITFL